MPNVTGIERLRAVFAKTDHKKLGVYFTVGFPALNDTLEIAKKLEQSGVDFIEIGVPFSDSLVDGPTIQAANGQALKNGMNLKELFTQLRSLRDHVQIPVILMGGLNPVLRFGLNEFLCECQSVGVDGVILPELPPDDYERSYRSLFQQYHIANIMLIAPNSQADRVQKIDQLSDSFIYVVSSTGTTGEKFSNTNSGANYLQQLAELQLKSPLMVGFGIRDAESFAAATSDAAGGIVGSQMLRILEAGTDLAHIKSFVQSLRA